MTNHDRPDPLEALLGPSGQPASDALREAVYRQTLPHLPQPPARWPTVLGAFALLLVGVGIGWFGREATLPVPPSPLPVVTMLHLPSEEPEDAPSPLPPEVLELQARAGEPELYRVAGDRYQAQERPLDALRCYGEALNHGASVEAQPEDSYLLMAIKHARERENRAWKP
jgi:hypothetical protein